MSTSTSLREDDSSVPSPDPPDAAADTVDPERTLGEGSEPEVAPGGNAEQKTSAHADIAMTSRRKARQPIAWSALLAFGLLPVVTLLLAGGAGFLKWQESSSRESYTARIQSVQAARDGTIALLSYHPDTVDRDLGAARDRLTGSFRDSYTSLIREVVIPGAKQKQISAVVTVPAAASVSATGSRAVVLVFLNQSTTIGADPPVITTSSVRVTLDKLDGHWLISDFTPV
jgi:Mce-associated membrane protein